MVVVEKIRITFTTTRQAADHLACAVEKYLGCDADFTDNESTGLFDEDDELDRLKRVFWRAASRNKNSNGSDGDE